MTSHRAKTAAVLMLAAVALAVAMRRVGPARTLDQRLCYSPAQAASLLEDLGSSGRERYRRNEFLDLGFIAVYTALAYVALGALWQTRLPDDQLARLRLLAFLPGLFDLAETTLVIKTLAEYPAGMASATARLSLLTPAKWGAAALLTGAALLGAVLPRRDSLPRGSWRG